MLNARMIPEEIDDLEEAGQRLGVSRSSLVRSFSRYGLRHAGTILPEEVADAS